MVSHFHIVNPYFQCLSFWCFLHWFLFTNQFYSDQLRHCVFVLFEFPKNRRRWVRWHLGVAKRRTYDIVCMLLCDMDCILHRITFWWCEYTESEFLKSVSISAIFVYTHSSNSSSSSNSISTKAHKNHIANQPPHGFQIVFGFLLSIYYINC